MLASCGGQATSPSPVGLWGDCGAGPLRGWLCTPCQSSSGKLPQQHPLASKSRRNVKFRPGVGMLPAGRMRTQSAAS